MAVVLNMRQTRPFGLDAHVDVLGHKADKFGWMIKLVFQRYIDDAIVVCLILRSIEVRDGVVRLNQLVRKDSQGTQRSRHGGAGDIDPFLDFARGRSTHDLIDHLNGNARFPTD